MSISRVAWGVRKERWWIEMERGERIRRSTGLVDRGGRKRKRID